MQKSSTQSEDDELDGFILSIVEKPVRGVALYENAAMVMFDEGKTLYIRIHDGELVYDFDWPS
jgi:hypothetical protein